MLSFTAYHEVTLAGETFEAGENTVEKPSAELRRHASSAEAAGVLEVHEGGDDAHIQSQEDGETAYALAVETGDWAEGNLVQAEIDQAAVEEIAEGVDA